MHGHGLVKKYDSRLWEFLDSNFFRAVHTGFILLSLSRIYYTANATPLSSHTTAIIENTKQVKTFQDTLTLNVFMKTSNLLSLYNQFDNNIDRLQSLTFLFTPPPKNKIQMFTNKPSILKANILVAKSFLSDFNNHGINEYLTKCSDIHIVTQYQ